MHRRSFVAYLIATLLTKAFMFFSVYWGATDGILMTEIICST